MMPGMVTELWPVWPDDLFGVRGTYISLVYST